MCHLVTFFCCSLFALVYYRPSLGHHKNFSITYSIKLFTKILHRLKHDRCRKGLKVFTSFVHLIVSNLRVTRRKKLILSIEFLKPFSEWEVFLLEVNWLHHTHICNLLQSHAVYKHTRSIVLVFWFWTGLDTPNEVELAVFCVIRNFLLLFIAHTKERLSKFIHQIKHLKIKLRPYSL